TLLGYHHLPFFQVPRPEVVSLAPLFGSTFRALPWPNPAMITVGLPDATPVDRRKQPPPRASTTARAAPQYHPRPASRSVQIESLAWRRPARWHARSPVPLERSASLTVVDVRRCNGRAFRG